MDGEIFLPVHLAYAQINGAGDQMDDHTIVAFARQTVQIDMGIAIQANKVLSAKMDFSSPFFRTQFISFDERQIDRSFFVVRIGGTLYENVSNDAAQTRIAVAVIIGILGRKECGR